MDIKNKVVNFINDEEGLTVVEYVLGAALLVAAISAVFSSLETGLITSLDNTLEAIDAKNGSTGTN